MELTGRIIFRQKVSKNVYHFDLLTTVATSVAVGEITQGSILINVASGKIIYNFDSQISREQIDDCLKIVSDLAKKIHKLETEEEN